MDIEIKREIFSEIGQRFSDFIKQDENHRIIFSGKFGSGKTTFLKLFFENPPTLNSEIKYEVFRISPVNYSISGNEDIIELIKYDLISQFLLKPHIGIETSDIPLQHFVSEKDILSIFRTLLSVIHYKGLDVDKLFKGLEKLKIDLEKRKTETDEGNTFANFLDRIESKNGIFERDLVTKTIEKVFDRINKKEFKTVLIIDDLDRIDPDHIFRILNVFSAHFEEEIFERRGLKNKFGFEKIIIVCDYYNIRSLFRCKYGIEADFNGYIDKFYSRTIFQFDIKSEIENYFRTILFDMDKKVVSNYGSSFNRFGKEELFEKSIIYSILMGLLTIRTLNKLPQANVEDHYNKLYKLYQTRSIRQANVYTAFLLALNTYLFGSLENLFKVLEILVNNNINIDIDSYLAEWIYKIETHLRRNSEDKSIEIITATNEYIFDTIEEGREKIAIGIIIKSTSGKLNNIQTLDVLKYFFNRVNHQTGIN